MLIEMTFALACMSKALYFEARSESMVGMLATNVLYSSSGSSFKFNPVKV